MDKQSQRKTKKKSKSNEKEIEMKKPVKLKKKEYNREKEMQIGASERVSYQKKERRRLTYTTDTYIDTWGYNIQKIKKKNYLHEI